MPAINQNPVYAEGIMARDEFSEATKRLVAQRASYRCSFPGCENITIGPGSGPESTVNTGQAAHIAAASGGGCRYDPNMTPSERASPDNAIWMCSLHVKIIDSDEERYDVGTLRAYKVAHESVCEGHIHGQAAALTRLKHRLSESVGIDRKWIPLTYQENLIIHDKEGRYATRSIRQRVLLNENGVRRVRIGDINSTTIAQNARSNEGNALLVVEGSSTYVDVETHREYFAGEIRDIAASFDVKDAYINEIDFRVHNRVTRPWASVELRVKLPKFWPAKIVKCHRIDEDREISFDPTLYAFDMTDFGFKVDNPRLSSRYDIWWSHIDMDYPPMFPS